MNHVIVDNRPGYRECSCGFAVSFGSEQKSRSEATRRFQGHLLVAGAVQKVEL